MQKFLPKHSLFKKKVQRGSIWNSRVLDTILKNALGQKGLIRSNVLNNCIIRSYLTGYFKIF